MREFLLKQHSKVAAQSDQQDRSRDLQKFVLLMVDDSIASAMSVMLVAEAWARHRFAPLVITYGHRWRDKDSLQWVCCEYLKSRSFRMVDIDGIHSATKDGRLHAMCVRAA